MRRFIDGRTLAMVVRSAGLAALVALGAPALAQAQSAIIYGSLSNFDISNDTGKVCHGFEVDVDGVQVADYSGSFTSNRYGTPVVAQTPTGVSVTWGTTYSASTGWATRTLPHTVPWFSGQCYQWVAGTYENGGCEHFGTYFVSNPTKVTSRWMCESTADASVLVPIDPPTATPFPYYYVQAPVVQNNPPQLVVEVPAPEPAEVVGQFGTAQWIRTFVTQLQQPINLDQLLADNPAVVPMDPAQLESDYSIIQDEPAAGGKGNRKRKRNAGNIDPTTRAIVRRIETWAFTGQYDAVTHEALCADLTCTAPAVGEIGDLLAVQMTGANVQPDALFISKIGNGTVSSGDKLMSCGSKCVQPYNAGTLVTLTAKASSGSTFAGWNGACAGTNATCTVPVNAATNVAATFALNVVTGGGGGGGGAGGTTTSFTLSVSSSNPGTITGTPAGDKTINCGKDCSAKFNSGTVVTLTATPPAGKAFLGWTDACLAAGTNTTCTVTMTANKSAKASFSK